MNIIKLYSNKLNLTISELNERCSYQLLIQSARLNPLLFEWLLFDCDIIYSIWKLEFSDLKFIIGKIVSTLRNGRIKPSLIEE